MSGGWIEREPDGVPARWLRSEIGRAEALVLICTSDRADWKAWAGLAFWPPSPSPFKLMVASVA